jgi:hypothetical protein
MACYICLAEGVTTSATGLCRKCNQNACGRPPQRMDGQFHGDLCAFQSCGLFFCEPHLHTHPHASNGVSSAFPTLSLAIGVDAISAAVQLENTRSISDVPVATELLVSFNRYLNVVSPGTTALYEQRARIPAHTFRIDQPDHDTRRVLFDGEFFTREAAATVARMALRTIWIAGSALHPRHQEGAVQRKIAPWIEALGTAPTLASVRLDAQQTDWLLRTLDRLPRTQVIQADLGELPSESAAEELTLFLLSKRDEGQTETRAALMTH